MPGSQEAASDAAGRVLRELLTRNPRYRRRWQQHVHRNRAADGISWSAVATVVALHLWESGERPDSQTHLPRQLRDRIRRALRGDVVSGETATWMINAFGMDDADARRLWAALSGARPQEAEVAHTLTERLPLLLPQRHQTQAVFERYQIGPAGALAAHHVMHVISATEDGVDRYPYVFGPRPSSFEVVSGGSLTRLHEYGGTLLLAEIALDRQIQRGEVALLEYLSMPQRAERPTTEVRRLARGRTENVDLLLRFSPGRWPSALWWAAWDREEGGDILVKEPMKLDERGCAHKSFASIEDAAVGLCWVW